MMSSAFTDTVLVVEASKNLTPTTSGSFQLSSGGHKQLTLCITIPVLLLCRWVIGHIQRIALVDYMQAIGLALPPYQGALACTLSASVLWLPRSTGLLYD